MADPSPRSDAASETPSERYQEALNRFVLFWGEMATNWGINRTMAQIHALLYAAEEALDTDTIMARLQISRGNANMNLRSLMGWNLVRKVHLPGSRKDFYTAEKDVWEITKQIIREREKREIRPVMQQLDECRAILTGEEAADCADLDAHERALCERLDRLRVLMEVFEGFSQALLPLIQQRNAPMLRQLIQFTATLQAKADDP